jgi:hypothetical protein
MAELVPEIASAFVDEDGVSEHVYSSWHFNLPRVMELAICILNRHCVFDGQ